MNITLNVFSYVKIKQYMNYRRRLWSNDYHRNKWTRLLEVKTWTRLFVFYIALIPKRKA